MNLMALLQVAFALQASLVTDQHVIWPNIAYDINTSSYMEPSAVTPNLWLKLCNNETPLLGKFAWLAYASEDGELFVPLQEFPAKIWFYNASEGCAYVDIDISPFKAVYPGIPWAFVGYGTFSNVTEKAKLSNTTGWFNGSVSVLGYFSEGKFKGIGVSVYDTYGNEIDANLRALVISAVLDGEVQDKLVVRPGERFLLNASRGAEIFVNGLIGLRIKPVAGCGVINESNYYYVLETPADLEGLNDTCLVVNTSSVVVDLNSKKVVANETNYTGKDCGIIVKDVSRVALVNGEVKFFPKGVCVENSSVVYLAELDVIGKPKPKPAVVNVTNQTNATNQTASNFTKFNCGVYFEKAKEVSYEAGEVYNYPFAICALETVKLFLEDVRSIGEEVSVYLNTTQDAFAKKIVTSTESVYPSRWDVVSYRGTVHHFEEFNSTSFSNFEIDFEDVGIKHVLNPPPDTPPWVNISQWALIENVTTNGSARFNFTYSIPLPYNIDPWTLNLWVADNETNYTWIIAYSLGYDVWPPDFAVNHTICGLRSFSNRFSIFAPKGKTLNKTKGGGAGGTEQGAPIGVVTEPKPVPQPVPQPVPTPTPQPTPPKINLKLEKKKFEVQQGETFLVPYNVTNEGEVSVDLTISALLPPDWQVLNQSFNLPTGAVKRGELTLIVAEDALPTKYLVPVVAKVGDAIVDMEVAEVVVYPRYKVSRLEIIEAPATFVLYEGQNATLPLLVKNTGDVELHNITLTLQNAEKCIERVEGSYSLKPGEMKSLNYILVPKEAPRKCESIAILKTKEGAVAFTKISLEVAFPPAKARVPYMLLTLLALWTLALLYYYWFWR